MGYGAFRFRHGYCANLKEFMNKPLALSLIIPAYNEEKHLAACLDSVALQTIMPLEVIVVDNNSTDGTKKLAQSYPFVRVVSEKKQGIVYARTKGFESAKGPLFGRIDADTIIPPNWVELMTNFYTDKKRMSTALTGSGGYYNTPFPKVSRVAFDFLAFRINRLALGHHFLYGSNMAFPKEMWEAVQNKVCTRTDIHEDVDLAIHVHQLGYKIRYDPSIHVTTMLRRVFQDHDKLWGVLMLWPQTYRVHHNPMWVTGWFGAALLYILTPLLYPFKWLHELRIRLFTRK